MSEILKSRGGLITWFRREPDGGLWIALSCATHRDWGIEYRFAPATFDEIKHAPRAVVIRVATDAMMVQAFESRQSCACATPLRLT